VSFSKSDHERNAKRAISKTIFLAGPNSSSSIVTHDASDVQAFIVSPSKLRIAVLRTTSDRDKMKRFVEIWSVDRLEASQEVTATHGAFYTDGKRFDYL
jgi:acylaminoacyl-peptidase